MAEFKGKLYIGTNHNFFCLTFASQGTGTNPEIPVHCADNLLDNDLRGRIYTYDPKTNQVELVFISPTFSALQSDGSTINVPRASGYRTMAVFTEPDGIEALYVGTFTSVELPGVGAQILRSVDGRHFEEVPLNFPNAGDCRSFRSLTVFKNKLFVLGLVGDTTAPVMFHSENPAVDGFTPSAVGGFGDPANIGAFELSVFEGYLYVGTFGISGFQLLKTKAEGQPPYAFSKVLVDGAYRGQKNQSVLSLFPFGDYLYVGTGIYFGAAKLIPDFQPAPAEIIRVRGDDSWELVVGDERQTPAGFKKPISGLISGFGNPFTGYMWRMMVHEGILYVGTLDNSVFAQYRSGIDLSVLDGHIDLSRYPNVAAVLNLYGPDEIADLISAAEEGFDLWATHDGETWRLISFIGLGDRFAYGIRSFVSSKLGLFVGSANPFTGMRLYIGQHPGTDTDGDSIPDDKDNCPTVWNLSQNDLDGDGIGDECDPDVDGDCIPNEQDPFPLVANVDSTDTDHDGVPDRCDPDIDGDGVLNLQDNCPLVRNFDQADSNGNGIGDACENTTSTPQTPETPPTSLSGPGDTPDKQVTGPTACGAAGALGFVGTLFGILALSFLHTAPRARRRDK
ncbi:MAG: thrombospondin type 3 repeat-containing protein [Planctomycetes bacterium]|nr:thrombospondin type 3 repeat-containing protein [Planctomycetota bacterium]MBI3834050.1 thrombospondin type 3 repeat-containing protein [Planctomycetota bacterium]